MLTGDMLRRSAERLPDKAAIIWENSRLSYRELNEQANRFAHALLGLGVKKEAKVAIISRNRPEYAIAFFGAARSGCVLVNVSVLYALDELLYVLDKADVEVLIFENAFAEKAVAAAAKLQKVRRTIVIGGIADGAVPFDNLIEGQSASYPDVAVDERDPFCMTYTGGTTGRPKGVLASHRARAVTAHTVLVESGLSETDVVAVVTPLFHVAALNIMLQPAILVGATSVLMAKWDVSVFADLVRTHRVSATFMVPTQVSMVISDPNFLAQDYQSWIRLNFSGAPMPDWVQRELATKLPQIRTTQFYGQSEMGIVASTKAAYLPAKLGTVGRQVFNVDMAVVDTNGVPVKPGEIGEIVTRGDNVMLEYYNELEQTKAFWRHGWAWSGDLGTIDADGFVTLVDRSKDMIISGGENIYPKEIEDVLYQHPSVSECAVFGIPDDKWGEVPAAYVQLKVSDSASTEELISHCEERLARFKRPRLVKLVDGFPKTPIGKIQKNLLREEYWADRKKKI